MKNYWVIVANASTTTIYSTSMTKSGVLNEEQHFDHPSSRLKNLDLVTDRLGHAKSDRPSGISFAVKTDPKDVEFDKFAREISHALDKGFNAKKFDELIVVSSPHFTGILKKHFSKSIKSLITHFIDKDYTSLNIRDLMKQILQECKPHIL